MIDDPIVEEVRTHRQAHAARYNYDLAAIFTAILEREKSSSRPVINRPPRRIPENLKADIS
jgi:hypothetical protein